MLTRPLFFSTYQNPFSLNFGVSRYVDLGDIASFERNQAFSVSMWLKTTLTATTHLMNRIKNSTPFTGWQFYKDGAQKLTFSLINDNTTNNIQVNGNSTSVNDGNYHHIAMTYDGSSNAGGVQIYLDSVAETMTITTNTLSASTIIAQNALMGKRSDNAGHLTGKIDEPTIYNKKLSQEEITQIYNLGKPRNILRFLSSSNLYLWLKFIQTDKDNFPILADHSGNGRNANAFNMTSADIQGDVP